MPRRPSLPAGKQRRRRRAEASRAVAPSPAGNRSSLLPVGCGDILPSSETVRPAQDAWTAATARATVAGPGVQSAPGRCRPTESPVRLPDMPLVTTTEVGRVLWMRESLQRHSPEADSKLSEGIGGRLTGGRPASPRDRRSTVVTEVINTRSGSRLTPGESTPGSWSRNWPHTMCPEARTRPRSAGSCSTQWCRA